MWLTVNHNTVSLLANVFEVRSVLHGQVSLAAVNQMCVIHETMYGCKNLKIHLINKDCFENLNTKAGSKVMQPMMLNDN